MATKKGDDQAVLDRPAEQSLATVGSSDVAFYDWGQEAGAGAEDISAGELLVPIYSIIGLGSKKCVEGNPKYVEGARPGMILNTALGDLYNGRTDGILVVPVKREHYYVERIPFDNAGGGFIGIWQPDDPRIARLKQRQGEFGTLKLENGHELAETRSLFVEVVHPDGSSGNGVIQFQSTQLKKYRSMMTRWTSVNNQYGGKLPLFALKWRFKTKEEGSNGQTWMGWVVTLEGGTPETALMRRDDPLYQRCRDFYELLQTGQAKADYSADGGGEHEGEIEQPF